MKLSSEEYQALEAIVGPEYINQEPVIMDTYNQVWGNKFFFDEKHSVRPAAVLLPANTEEIAAAVKVCNQYGILFKAFSSGFEYLSLSLVNSKGILFDLRRMNRIIEIDAKNMRAVVEPYVSVYKLQLEAAKNGLFTGRIGVGYSAGVIATECCHHGCQHTMVFTSGYGRNVLGVEWVLPTGEVLRMGTGETGGDLFSADGPGFSLRGILRGRTGANGGHGVITRAAIKLYPWYGPANWEQKKQPGEAPCKGQLDAVPDGYKVFVPSFPDLDRTLAASEDLCRAEILCAFGIGIIGTTPFSEGNDEEWAAMQAMMTNTISAKGPSMANSVVAVIGGQSRRELEYKEKCLRLITEKWGGEFSPAFNEPRALARAFADIMWSNGVNLRATGDFLPSSSSPDGSPAMLKDLALKEGEVKKRYEQAGMFLALGSGARMVSWRPEENLAIGAQGISTAQYDPYDPASLKAARDFINELFDPRSPFSHYGVPSRGGCLQIEPVTHVHQNWGPLYDNYDKWLQQIKKMLDPNSVADWTAYIPPEYPEYKKDGDYVLPSYGKDEKL
ncbi:MAG: FAD-binding oxidoreductase [Dehalococcoidales bacterium]|jgi:glycolate oxidase